MFKMIKLGVSVVTNTLFCLSHKQYIHVIARSPETSGWQSYP